MLGVGGTFGGVWVAGGGVETEYEGATTCFSDFLYARCSAK